MKMATLDDYFLELDKCFDALESVEPPPLRRKRFFSESLGLCKFIHSDVA